MESEVIGTTGQTIQILQNEYAVGDDVTIKYREGNTIVACLAAEWTLYTVPFLPLDYMQIRIEFVS